MTLPWESFDIEIILRNDYAYQFLIPEDAYSGDSKAIRKTLPIPEFYSPEKNSKTTKKNWSGYEKKKCTSFFVSFLYPRVLLSREEFEDDKEELVWVREKNARAFLFS